VIQLPSLFGLRSLLVFVNYAVCFENAVTHNVIG